MECDSVWHPLETTNMWITILLLEINLDVQTGPIFDMSNRKRPLVANRGCCRNLGMFFKAAPWNNGARCLSKLHLTHWADFLDGHHGQFNGLAPTHYMNQWWLWLEPSVSEIWIQFIIQSTNWCHFIIWYDIYSLSPWFQILTWTNVHVPYFQVRSLKHICRTINTHIYGCANFKWVAESLLGPLLFFKVVSQIWGSHG